jgi:LL-H family phage holin
MDFSNILGSPLLANLVYLAILGMIGLYGKPVHDWVVSHTSANTATLLITLADTAVTMVQQQLGANGPNQEKKGLAYTSLTAMLDARKLKIDDASVHAAIESAVYKMKNPAGGPGASINVSAPQAIDATGPSSVVNVSAPAPAPVPVEAAPVDTVPSPPFTPAPAPVFIPAAVPAPVITDTLPVEPGPEVLPQV